VDCTRHERGGPPAHIHIHALRTSYGQDGVEWLLRAVPRYRREWVEGMMARVARDVGTIVVVGVGLSCLTLPMYGRGWWLNIGWEGVGLG